MARRKQLIPCRRDPITGEWTRPVVVTTETGDEWIFWERADGTVSYAVLKYQAPVTPCQSPARPPRRW